MTSDKEMEQDFKDGTQYQQQQQQNAFHVVLVDIEKAAKDHIIHCVEKLSEGETEDVAYVALSYHGGKCQETHIDTHLGYSIAITSFPLDNFYRLCSMMTCESDLKSIKYVWVDAICMLDTTNNNHDDEQRQATMDQMLVIYDRAKYILAVPDLHLQLPPLYELHLHYKIRADWWHRHMGVYLYHLIQGNTRQLVELDDAFVDKIQLPNNSALRRLLKTYTHFFSDGYTTLRKRAWQPSSETTSISDHIYETAMMDVELSCALQHRRPGSGGGGGGDHRYRRKPNKKTRVNDWQRPCHSEKCPFHWLRAPMAHWDEAWSRRIIERQGHIQESLACLTNSIMDWSCQARGMRDCLMAKTKNNLKIWFHALALVNKDKVEEDGFGACFPFDFAHRTAFFSAIQKGALSKKDHDDPHPDHPKLLLPIEQDFHRMMINQLNPQTFIEMILKPRKPRFSEHDDRFQVLLPLSKYKHYANQAASWKIDTRESIQFKLYEIMDTEDKLTLLFLIGNTFHPKRFESSPTFAIPEIDWTDVRPEDFVFKKKNEPLNFDLTNPSTAIIHERLYCLCITPREYYALHPTQVIPRAFLDSAEKTGEFSKAQLELDSLGHCRLDLVSIASFYTRDCMKSRSMRFFCHRIYLIGSFVDNRWVLCPFGKMFDRNDWKYCPNEQGQGISFRIF
ncbi:hypothetical protein BCR42DRAFT_159313 [Absidia repens]|uniref:Heterokaryon incompatibility domain-containing protein n=1 Tax=Absidia repens TaxID=90262 RepID=A0A1X2HZZ0_9FUNG|nr:hypothetical protein BCR42DRAFT_159313 [Absidia repens]